MSDIDRKNDPAFHCHYARVMIREAKIRRAAGQINMAAMLMQWAKNGRRRYWEAVRASKKDPAQGEMFA